jgi:hypothetical protein
VRVLPRRLRDRSHHWWIELNPSSAVLIRICPRHVVRGRTGFLYAEHVPTTGKDLYQVICREDLEGIVARHKLMPYVTSPPILVQGAESGLYAEAQAQRDVRQVKDQGRARYCGNPSLFFSLKAIPG